VKNGIEIRPVRWIDQVLELALERLPTPLPELTPEEIAKAAEASKSASGSSSEVLKH
jgi:ATP-dependent Lon protease